MIAIEVSSSDILPPIFLVVHLIFGFILEIEFLKI